MAQAENVTPGPDKKEVLKIIFSELEKVNEQGIKLQESTDITTDMNVDSVAIMDLVFELEESFDISVPLNDLADIRTIGELADLVLKIARDQA